MANRQRPDLVERGWSQTSRSSVEALRLAHSRGPKMQIVRHLGVIFLI
jgi:hypothetical protein